jgi:hypothetical protein
MLGGSAMVQYHCLVPSEHHYVGSVEDSEGNAQSISA